MLTITDGTTRIVINPRTMTITTNPARLNIGAVGTPHRLTVSAVTLAGGLKRVAAARPLT